MSEHGNLIVCESSLDAIKIISELIVIVIVIIDIFLVGSVTLAATWKMRSLKDFQIILSTLIHQPTSFKHKIENHPEKVYAYRCDTGKMEV